MKYNQLKDAEVYRLYSWVEKNAQKIRSLEDETTAIMATNELGFTVVSSNVNSARLTLGIKKRSKIDSRQTAKELSERIAKLESAMDLVMPTWRES